MRSQRPLLEEILHFGERGNLALEAGANGYRHGGAKFNIASDVTFLHGGGTPLHFKVLGSFKAFQCEAEAKVPPKSISHR
jgi:hypothetical protein